MMERPASTSAPTSAPTTSDQARARVVSIRIAVVFVPIAIAAVLGGGGGRIVAQEIPIELPGLTKKKAADADKKAGADRDPAASAVSATDDAPAPAPTEDNPEATVATTSGPINVDEPVDDQAVAEALNALLAKYPGVRSIQAEVDQGVVELTGHVEDDAIREQMTRVARQIEGVRMVVNRLKTDAQVLTSAQIVRAKLERFGNLVSRRWLVAVLALVVVLIFSSLARLFNAYSETLLAPFVTNHLLRSVVGSLIGALMIFGGVLLALRIVNLTEVVLSMLGLASIVGLAIGFAFRDIAENFIASVLLGLRRPFRVGDFVTVAGHSGVVRSLNTRATVLATLDGKHVRMPNNIIFKEILVNASASSSTRGEFDVLIPYEASTAAALDAMAAALRTVDAVLADPPARALVQALEPDGVRLRAYFWMPSQGVDAFKLQSDAKLKVKVNLQAAGVVPSPPRRMLTLAGTLPVELFGALRAAPAASSSAEPGSTAAPDGAAAPPAVAAAEQAAMNLWQDASAASRARVVAGADQPTPAEHVLKEAESRLSDEGANLLVGPAPARP